MPLTGHSFFTLPKRHARDQAVLLRQSLRASHSVSGKPHRIALRGRSGLLSGSIVDSDAREVNLSLDPRGARAWTRCG